MLDFSVAKLDAPDAQVTRAGVVFGTPQYMSPEQGRGIPLDARSDIYAVGIVAYEMLTGKPPFDAKVPTEVVMMHLRDKPAPLIGLPPQLMDIVMRALEKDPNKRQQSADALDQECQQCLAELFPRQTPGLGHQVTPPAMAPPPAMHAPPPAAMAPPLAAMAPPPTANVAHGAPPLAEQKTMMAMEAPRVAAAPHSAPPPAAHEAKTMMAMEAPRIGAAPQEVKTMMAMEAPRIAGGLAPPPAAPPPPSAPPLATGGANMKTMMAQEAPALSAQKTMMAQAGGGIADGSTKVLPDSAGVVAYAQERAHLARASASHKQLKTPPAGALFWLAWVLVGVGAGLGVHFYLLQRG